MPVEFWAKSTTDEQPGISVFEHMRNVGHVARALACVAPDLLTRFQMGVAEVGVLAALHDLGKISPGFQRKCTAWLECNGLTDVARSWAWDTTMEGDHGAVTHAVVQRFLTSMGMKRRSAKYLAAVLGGHHGRLHRLSDRGFKPQKSFVEPNSGIDCDAKRDAAARSDRQTDFDVRRAQLYCNHPVRHAHGQATNEAELSDPLVTDHLLQLNGNNVDKLDENPRACSWAKSK